MWKTPFQQTKSTKAVHVRLPDGIGGSTCSVNTDLIPDQNPSQSGMYSSVGDKEES